MNYDNTNRGILGKNDRMTKDTSPGYTGSLNVEGVEYYLDGWVKERKDGTGKFFSLSIKRKDAPKAAPVVKAAPAKGSGFDDMSDDCPF